MIRFRACKMPLFWRLSAVRRFMPLWRRSAGKTFR
jgi:hypothetical protein